MTCKAPKIFFVLLSCCLSCHHQTTYAEANLHFMKFSNLIEEYSTELGSAVANNIQYGESGSLVNIYSDKVYSFLNSMQKIIDFGEDAEGLNFQYYNVDMLSRNQVVLQEILEHPEYLEGVVEAYPYEAPEGTTAEIRLIHIIPMPDDQYVLGFLTSIGMVPESAYFLFSIKNGIEEDPLRLTALDNNQLQIINSGGSSFIGKPFYDYEGENEYFYFLYGKRSRAYSSLKYSLVDGQLVLEEQITGVRQMSESNDFVIVHFVRQANQFTNVSSIECQSPIAFSDVQDGSSLVDACERKELSGE